MSELLLLRGAMGAGKTSIAAKLRELSPELAIIEIDDIKIRKYGTTEKCVPRRRFQRSRCPSQGGNGFGKGCNRN